MKKYKTNPFVENLNFHSRAMTADKSLKTVWKKLPPGMGAGYSSKTNTIIMPLVDVYSLTEEQSRKLMALAYHERQHYFESDCEKFETEAPKLPKIKKNLWNVLEDCRIEQHDVQLPGGIEDVQFYKRVIEAKEYEEDWTLLLANNSWGAIMCALQGKLCDYWDLPLPRNFQKYFDIAWKIIQDGRYQKSLHVSKPGSTITQTLADEIVEAWKIEADQDPNVSKSKSPNGEWGEDESDENQEGEESEGDDESEESDGDDEGEGSEGDEGNPSGKKSNKKGKGKGKGKGNGKDSKDGEDSENSKGKGDKKDKGGEKKGRDIEKEFDDAQDGDNPFDPEHLNKEMGDLSREGKDEGDKDRRGGGKQGYVPYNACDKTIVAQPYPNEYNSIRDSIQEKMMITRKELTRILIGLSQDEIVSALRHGELDEDLLDMLAMGSTNVFFEEKDCLTLSSSVQLVIDLSGSMQGHRAKMAAQVAILFGETLNALRLPFEVIGFNTGGMGYEHSRKAQEMGCSRTHESVNRWIFKEFKENFIVVRNRLGSLMTSSVVNGGTVDWEVIHWGASRLWAQPTQRKIQIVITDGCSGNADELKRINAKIKKYGIEQFAFGVSCNEVEENYEKSKVLGSINDMNIEALQILANALRYNKEMV